MAKKTYVLDTNVYLTEAESIMSFTNNDILVPLKVLDEIDKHKKRQETNCKHVQRGRKGVIYSNNNNKEKGIPLRSTIGIP